MDEESEIDEKSMDYWEIRLWWWGISSWMGEQMNNWVDELEIYTRWRIKIKRCNGEAVWWAQEEGEGHCQLKYIRIYIYIYTHTQLLYFKTHFVTRHTTPEKKEEVGKRGWGSGTIGTAQRSLVTTIDRRTPNGHYGMTGSTVCVPMHSPGCQNLAVS